MRPSAPAVPSVPEVQHLYASDLENSIYEQNIDYAIYDDIDANSVFDLRAEYENDYENISDDLQNDNVRNDLDNQLHSTNQFQNDNNFNSITQNNEIALSIANALHSTLATIKETSLNSQNSKIMSRISNKKTLPAFSGDPLDWTRYKQAYDISTEILTVTLTVTQITKT